MMFEMGIGLHAGFDKIDVRERERERENLAREEMDGWLWFFMGRSKVLKNRGTHTCLKFERLTTVSLFLLKVTAQSEEPMLSSCPFYVPFDDIVLVFFLFCCI